jgi:hypothetical protein
MQSEVLPRHLPELVDSIVKLGFLLTEALPLPSKILRNLLSGRLDIELAVSTVRNPSNFHFLIRFEILVANDILQPSIVRLILPLKHIDIENIIPQEMLFPRMFSKILILFLQRLPCNITNITFILLILLPSFLFLPQTTKRIKHKRTNNASKHNLEKDKVDHIVTKPNQLESLHCFTYCSGYIELTKTVHH